MRLLRGSNGSKISAWKNKESQTEYDYVRFYGFLLFLVGMFLSSLIAAGELDHRVPRVPLVTKQCIVEGDFSCALSVDTLSVAGVSCTENCLIVSDLNTCDQHNSCLWDDASGCFRKRVCAQISELNTCSSWEEQAICP